MRYAHTLPDLGPEHWEPIERHLAAVADCAASFAGRLCPAQGGCAEWGRALGLWHDLGKYSDAFQDMLNQANGVEAHIEQQAGRVNHSSAGAQHANEVGGKWARLLAYIIAGHHAGLSDASRLTARLDEVFEGRAGNWKVHANSDLLRLPPLDMPPVSIDHKDRHRFTFQCAFFTRMLFSCLLDADRLETERFCNPERAEQRQTPIDIPRLTPVLDKYLDDLAAKAKPSAVNRQRQEVLQACRAAADKRAGFFSLAVPTGGGKTLASLAFALRHATHHDMRRVVMAIPFTSIIEQTAGVYRGVFEPLLGEGVVLEHHSNLDPEKETRQNRLAAENWDAPLVVSTNVQLFNSLFASRTTPCRKLHRLAGSVIILDEAQTLPVRLLRPCLAALQELVTDYGCTVVLCTATQPAIEQREDFPIGLSDVHPIIPEPEKLAATMRRVEPRVLGTMSDDELPAL